jgi:hypothetical protein
MAYPGEQDHVNYLDYVESHASGQIPGPMLTKEEWLKQKKAPQAPPTTPNPQAVSGVVDALMRKKQ